MYNKVKELLKKNEKLRAFVQNNKIISRIRLEATPMGFTRNYIAFPIRRFYRKYISCPEYAKKIEMVKDKHKGKRCFIIATGPSLTREDLLLLDKEITIGVNSIYKVFADNGWRPTYYAMADISLTPKVVKNDAVNFDDCATDYCFFNAINRDIIKCQKSIFLDINWLDHNYNTSNFFKYDPDLRYGIYDCYSITHVCIELAMYMGFKDIYIIGVDNDYGGEKKHIAEVTGEKGEWTKADAANMTKRSNWGYAYIDRLAKERGIKIYNCTRGGKVEPFERIKLEDVVGKNSCI